MKKTLHTFLILLSSSLYSFAQDTFSIVAIDPSTGEVGSAGASCIANSVIISDVHPGVGAIHTQAQYLAQNQIYGRALMNEGYSSQDIVDSMVANDWQSNPTVRQYGVIEFSSGSAAYTGINCFDWKGHLTGPTYSIQGNILLGPQIIDSMEATFLRTQGSLSCRLMAALQGAKVPGADSRCLSYGISTLSAFLRVAKSTDVLPNLSVNLIVPAVSIVGRVIDPIDSLNKLFQQSDAYGECTVTGISFYNSSVKRASIDPNPSKDFITVKSILPVKEIIMTDVLGRNTKVIEANGASKISLDVTSMLSGLVFVRLIYANGFTERLPFVHIQ